MELAIVGLGKMGLNMSTRLVRGGHRVIGYARTAATVDEAVKLVESLVDRILNGGGPDARPGF